MFAVRSARGERADLGRALPKFESNALTLDTLVERARQLEEACNNSSSLPSTTRTAPIGADLRSAAQGVARPSEPAQPPSAVGDSLVVDPERVKWDFGPSFDAVPFLGDGFLRGFSRIPR